MMIPLGNTTIAEEVATQDQVVEVERDDTTKGKASIVEVLAVVNHTQKAAQTVAIIEKEAIVAEEMIRSIEMNGRTIKTIQENGLSLIKRRV